MIIKSPITTIIIYSTIIRILTTSFLFLLPLIIDSFDSSSSIILSSTTESYLRPFLKWDTIYFIQIAKRGYKFENELAFLPGLPILLRFGGLVLSRLKGNQSVEDRDMMIFGIILSCFAGILAAVTLYKLTLAITHNSKFSFLTTLLFLLPPSPTTLASIPYTEPYSALFTFLGMFYFIKNRNLLAALSWSLGTIFKSQGIVLGIGFFGWRFILRGGEVREERQGLFKLKGLIRRILYFVTLSAISITPFVVFQLWTHLQFCHSLQGNIPRPWCNQGLGGSYSWIQSEYWNVGPFKYWTIQQLPNFILAFPILFTSFFASYTYYSHNYQQILISTFPFLPSTFFSSNSSNTKSSQIKESNSSTATRPFLSIKLIPFIHLHTALTLILLITSHVQIILRVCSTNPVLFWFIADLISAQSSSSKFGDSKSEVQNKTDTKEGKTRKKWGKRWISYCLIWGSISCLLWCGFYPPA